MIRPIISDRLFLKQKCEPVTTQEEADALIKDLEETLATKKGLGLASIQICILKQAAIVRIGNDKIDLINPVILDRKNKCIFKGEGCLSFNGLYIDTDRYEEIWIETGLGDKRERIVLRGIHAVVGLHEVEHLNGVIFLDRKHKARR